MLVRQFMQINRTLRSDIFKIAVFYGTSLFTQQLSMHSVSTGYVNWSALALCQPCDCHENVTLERIPIGWLGWPTQRQCEQQICQLSPSHFSSATTAGHLYYITLYPHLATQPSNDLLQCRKLSTVYYNCH